MKKLLLFVLLLTSAGYSQFKYSLTIPNYSNNNIVEKADDPFEDELLNYFRAGYYSEYEAEDVFQSYKGNLLDGSLWSPEMNKQFKLSARKQSTWDLPFKKSLINYFLVNFIKLNTQVKESVPVCKVYFIYSYLNSNGSLVKDTLKGKTIYSSELTSDKIREYSIPFSLNKNLNAKDLPLGNNIEIVYESTGLVEFSIDKLKIYDADIMDTYLVHKNNIHNNVNELARYYKPYKKELKFLAENNPKIYNAITSAFISDVNTSPNKLSKSKAVTSNLNNYQYSLSQNYPNPFNPETRIIFSLQEDSHVNLNIYDMLGRLICCLADKEFNKGVHSVIFNSADMNLPSGYYIYQIETTNFSESKKMLLLK